MAVELAKVALWLHTFTVGAPLSFLDHHLRCGNSLFGYWISEALDRSTKWGGQLLLNEPMTKAMAQAVAMRKLERVTDVDIAEVHESKTLFDGIEQETQPLNTFINTLYALDWQKLDKADETAIRAWLDGQFGDPFDVARGKILLGPSDIGLNHPQGKDVLDRLPAKIVATAERFAVLLNRSRELIGRERFQNWQVSFPGVWKQWESVELNGGFDAVIGNPPYVRHELLGSAKPALKRAFQAYDGYADLYIYFYEQGLKLLAPGGRLSYVVTNKWLRAGYAEELRELFADKAWVEFVADFGHAKKFFPDADVFPSVIVVRKPSASLTAPAETIVCAIPRDDVPEKHLDEAVAKASYMLPRAHFTKDNWIIEPPAVVALFNKIKGTGTALADVVGKAPMYGVKTGFNQAFLIDTPTRDRLVAEHASADEIIRPYLRGQDVARWQAETTGLWMIFARRGINIDAYPSVKRHLESFQTRLQPRPDDWKPSRPGEKWPGRKKGTYAWYELQDAVDYWREFSRPKIIYKVIQFYASYAFDGEGRLGNDKTFIIPTEDLSLLAILNSPLMWWFNWRHLTHLKDEALSPMGYKMERLPIAAFSETQKQEAARLVRQVIQATSAVSAATSSIRDWLHHTFGIEKLGRAILNFDALTPDTFVTLTQSAMPRKTRLTAKDITELKREFSATIEPARAQRRMIFAIEQELSALVTSAYGLTSDEIALMWETAPPRMPFTPAGLIEDLTIETQDDDDGDEES